MAGQDLVWVMVEGDDGRLRLACTSFRDEVPQQIEVAQVEPVEYADHDEHRTMLRQELLDPVDNLHRSWSRSASGGR